MPVKELTEKYQCSDGRRFTNKPDAARHEKLIKAKEDYDMALRAYNIALVQSRNTADGKPFELGVWKTYYYVRQSAYGMPHLFEVPYLGYNFDVCTENDEVKIIVHEGERRISFRISEVYADKTEAERALLADQKEALKHYQEEMGKLEERVKGDGK